MDKKHNGPSVNPMLDSFVSKYDEATKRAIRERDDYAEELRAEVYKVEQERDALAIQNQQMREALESIYDGPDPLASYHHGIRCGVEDQMIEDKYEAAEYGYDDALQYCAHIAKQALSLPDTSEIIKRHDAAVLRKAAEHLHAKARAYLNEFDRRVAHDMASALEKSCPPSN